jgi:alpha-L-arabinofuranosidase
MIGPLTPGARRCHRRKCQDHCFHHGHTASQETSGLRTGTCNRLSSTSFQIQGSKKRIRVKAWSMRVWRGGLGVWGVWDLGRVTAMPHNRYLCMMTCQLKPHKLRTSASNQEHAVKTPNQFMLTLHNFHTHTYTHCYTLEDAHNIHTFTTHDERIIYVRIGGCKEAHED